MKSMKKLVLVGLVLLASVMVLVGCDTNAGANPKATGASGSGEFVHPEIGQFLTFSANSPQTLTVKVTETYTLDSTLEYSVGGEEWVKLVADTPITFGGAAGSLSMRGKSKYGMARSQNDYAQFTFGNSGILVTCSGDIRTLVDWVNYSVVNTQSARFCNLFMDCTNLTSAPQLPSTTLADYCYYAMFKNCSNLIYGPEKLPALTLVEGCYSSMFDSCSKLITTPELCATSLAKECYNSMFMMCSSLISVPDLPITDLAVNCYNCMFFGCTNLVKGPVELPATTLEEGCYMGMFESCKNLTCAPILPATELAKYCYYNMFKNCTSLNNVTMMANNISATDCLVKWLATVAESGTLTIASGMGQLLREAGAIPDGWTVVEK